jgi:PTH2 family peptidyl-tRNA hydrolase
MTAIGRSVRLRSRPVANPLARRGEGTTVTLAADGPDGQVASALVAGVVSPVMKQAIVARADLGMGEGKLAAQVAHASLMAYEDADRTVASEWKGSGQKKVVLQANGDSALFELADKAERDGLPHAIVRDAGHTQLEPGTVTALAVGPEREDLIDAVTGDLSLY